MMTTHNDEAEQCNRRSILTTMFTTIWDNTNDETKQWDRLKDEKY
jgi:hypothetical protein